MHGRVTEFKAGSNQSIVDIGHMSMLETPFGMLVSSQASFILFIFYLFALGLGISSVGFGYS